jgi:hypothetical protein
MLPLEANAFPLFLSCAFRTCLGFLLGLLFFGFCFGVTLFGALTLSPHLPLL